MQEILIAIAGLAVGGVASYVVFRVRQSGDSVLKALPGVKAPKVGDTVYDRGNTHTIKKIYPRHSPTTGKKFAIVEFENEKHLKKGLVQDLKFDKHLKGWKLPGREGPQKPRKVK